MSPCPCVRLSVCTVCGCFFSQPDSSDGGSTRQQTTSVTGALAIQLVSPPLTKIILAFFSSPLYPAPTTSRERKKKKHNAMAPADNVTQTISPSITCLFVSFCRDKVAMVMMESVLMPAPLSENNNNSHPSTFRAGAKHLKFFSRASHRQPEPAKTTCHLTLTS